MILSVHILAGAAIAAKTQNPALGIFCAYLSHYLLDIPPQAEYSIDNIKKANWRKSLPDFLKVFLDAGAGLLIIYLLVGNNTLIYLAALAAIIPDSFSFFSFIFPKNKLLQRHQFYHNKLNNIIGNKTSPLWGGLTQLLIAVLAIYFLL